jgi:hypothetical protein
MEEYHPMNKEIEVRKMLLRTLDLLNTPEDEIIIELEKIRDGITENIDELKDAHEMMDPVCGFVFREAIEVGIPKDKALKYLNNQGPDFLFSKIKEKLTSK